ncbi:MAG: 4-hydroxythreonine-4-phosphate dehydrogenase PdxA [Gammaproteobacteria bacterium]|nr:4-hydroxythreonine-4-phosphate dehydrogenase PdxA [Gammaproteobacteria bacterium]
MSIAFTPGEPSGIGPDLAIMASQQDRSQYITAYCDPDILQKRAKKLGLPIHLTESPTTKQGELCVYPISAKSEAVPGVLNADNSEYVLNTLAVAGKHCLNGETSGLLTGPVHKGVINEAGVEFSGHTEFFARLSNVSKTVMLLATDTLKVALATTHLPLRQVSNNITQESLTEVIEIINHDFRYFGINKPHILVCGLNPHAGEDGHLGDEEITTISPVIQKLNTKGYHLSGPVPADTAFTPNSLAGVDVVLAMYHDQGLPVLKTLGFKKSANITLGLPFFRTSVDHGTALDLAGTGNISLGSFHTALSYFNTLNSYAAQS